MNGRINFRQNLKTEYILPFAFGLVILFVFAFIDQTVRNIQSIAEVLTVASLFIICAVALFLYKKNKLSYEAVIYLIFACGFALRLCYALKIGYFQNQHDVESLNSSGHLSYINYIFNNGSLPDTNYWQFSHPPLHHLISAVVVWFGDLLGFSLERSFENIQLLTVIYSSVSMIIGVKICSELGVNVKALIICCLILAFFPGMFVLAGSINNDILMIMLTLISLLYLIKWYKAPSLKFAVISGMFCGLAMMTKVSAALFAVVAGITVLIKLIFDKSLRFGRVALHSFLFVILLLPLGLWHPIRNYILFEQPLGYVAPIPVTNPLYTGSVSIVKRLLLPFSTEGVGVYVDVWEEHNVWGYVLRNSLFGEYNFGSQGIALFAVLVNLFLILVSLSAFVTLLKDKNNIKKLLPLILFYIIQLAFFIYFNIRYPFGCSMDFRYIVPLFFIGVVFIGLGFQKHQNENSVFALLLKYFTCFSTAVLCFTSVLLFV